MARKRRRPPAAPPVPWDRLHPTLDLHGETAEGARRRAEAWLRAERDQGARTVRLITGRGLHSAGPPVLPGEIEALLGSLRGTVVARFEREPGGGVYRVELRRAPRSAPPPAAPRAAPAPPQADPELRRRAEESLVELGITPTPILIEAEMRRLSHEQDREAD
jgi:hypothetical protein